MQIATFVMGPDIITMFVLAQLRVYHNARTHGWKRIVIFYNDFNMTGHHRLMKIHLFGIGTVRVGREFAIRSFCNLCKGVEGGVFDGYFGHPLATARARLCHYTYNPKHSTQIYFHPTSSRGR